MFMGSCIFFVDLRGAPSHHKRVRLGSFDFEGGGHFLGIFLPGIDLENVSLSRACPGV